MPSEVVWFKFRRGHGIKLVSLGPGRDAFFLFFIFSQIGFLALLIRFRRVSRSVIKPGFPGWSQDALRLWA